MDIHEKIGRNSKLLTGDLSRALHLPEYAVVTLAHGGYGNPVPRKSQDKMMMPLVSEQRSATNLDAGVCFLSGMEFIIATNVSYWLLTIQRPHTPTIWYSQWVSAICLGFLVTVGITAVLLRVVDHRKWLKITRLGFGSFLAVLGILATSHQLPSLHGAGVILSGVLLASYWLVRHREPKSGS